MQSLKRACSWAQVVALVVIVGLTSLLMFSTDAYSQEVVPPPAGVTFTQVKEWAATFVLFAGAAGAVMKLIEWRKNSQKAENAPIAKAHERIDDLAAVVAEVIAEMHPKEEPRHLAWRKEIDTERAALKSTVASIASASTVGVENALRRVNETIERLERKSDV